MNKSINWESAIDKLHVKNKFFTVYNFNLNLKSSAFQCKFLRTDRYIKYHLKSSKELEPGKRFVPLYN